MSPRPHDGPAEEGLSAALLRIVQDGRKVELLRARLSGFCHRCRNSLNGIKLSLYLFRREARDAVPPCWGELESDYKQVERLFDALQTVYRPMPIATVRLNLGSYLEEQLPKWRLLFESRGLTIRLVAPESPVVSEVDPVQFQVGLDALANWRAESGRTGMSARLTWRARDGAVELGWEETPADRGEGSPEGSCPDADREGRAVDCLALPILARVVAQHGGRLHFSRDPALAIRVRWPQFQSARVGACREA